MSTVFVLLLIAGVIFWNVSRSSGRRARRLMLWLAKNEGGTYLSGGLFGDSLVRLHRGQAEIQIDIRPRTRWGSQVTCRLMAPWKNRASIERTANVVHANKDSGIDVSRSYFEAKRGCFELVSVIGRQSFEDVSIWYQAAIQRYEELLADTEPGILFAEKPTTAATRTVCCTVCGTLPEKAEIVCCDRCGAPHHAECWEYNNGCGIYGCKRP